LSQLKWGVLLSYLTMGLGILVSLIYTPFVLRVLDQSEWGLYQLVASVVGYLSLLSFGFGGAYIRFYSRAAVSDDAVAVSRVNGLFLIVFLVIGAVAVAVGAGLTANAGFVLGDKLTAQEVRTAQILMALMTFTVSISFPASVFSSFVMANERFVFQRTLSLVRVVVTPTLTVLVLLAGQRSVGMAAVAAVVALVMAAIDIYYCLSRINMRFSFKSLDMSFLREIAVFSSFIFMNMLVDQINWNVDKFILGRVGGTSLVAVYAVAAQLNSYYLSLSTTVSSVFVPRVNKMVAVVDDNKALTHLFTRVGRIQFLVLALIASGLVVFGKPFLVWWAGSDYSGAYPIVLLLVLSATIPLVQNLGIEIQRAKNMHQFRSWLYLGIAIMNVALSIPLAQRYGGVGAAAGTAAALLVGNGLIMNWYYHTRVGLDMRHFWRSIVALLPGLVPVIGVGAAIMMLVDLQHPGQMVAWGLLFVAVYCCSMWLLGMDTSEKDLIRGPLGRFLRGNTPTAH